MGKTGTTNEFRDAIFVFSTYGPDGITAAVRIGFDDNRSLGSGETGARLALPVFQELMLAVYRDKIVGARAGVSGPGGRAHYGLTAAAHRSPHHAWCAWGAVEVLLPRQTSPAMPSYHLFSARASAHVTR
jgi:membrane peptidoglycan carboxypeptidase